MNCASALPAWRRSNSSDRKSSCDAPRSFEARPQNQPSSTRQSVQTWRPTLSVGASKRCALPESGDVDDSVLGTHYSIIYIWREPHDDRSPARNAVRLHQGLVRLSSQLAIHDRTLNYPHENSRGRIGCDGRRVCARSCSEAVCRARLVRVHALDARAGNLAGESGRVAEGPALVRFLGESSNSRTSAPRHRHLRTKGYSRHEHDDRDRHACGHQQPRGPSGLGFRPRSRAALLRAPESLRRVSAR